jgi:hypothetical protein
MDGNFIQLELTGDGVSILDLNSVWDMLLDYTAPT